MIRAIAKLTAPLHRRVMLMVGRAAIELVNDALTVQGLQVSLMADEVRDNVERFQQYGLTSHPHPGAEGIVVCVGGSRDHAVVIACDDRRYRLQGLEQGEVALYDDLGQSIILKRDGIVLNTPTKDVTVNALNLKVNGNIIAMGDISDQTIKSTAAMRTAFNNHTHIGHNSGTATDTPPTAQRM
jgi:phage baseplate assembly protein V